VLVQTTLAELLLLLKWGKFKGSKGGRVEYCSVRGALVCVCREFLRKYKHARAAQGLADFPAVQLREAIVASGLVLYCKGVFIQAMPAMTPCAASSSPCCRCRADNHQIFHASTSLSLAVLSTPLVADVTLYKALRMRINVLGM
jgi:hypothetical protein